MMTEHTPQGKHETYYPQKEGGGLMLFLYHCMTYQSRQRTKQYFNSYGMGKKEIWYFIPTT